MSTYETAMVVDTAWPMLRLVLLLLVAGVAGFWIGRGRRKIDRLLAAELRWLHEWQARRAEHAEVMRIADQALAYTADARSPVGPVAMMQTLAAHGQPRRGRDVPPPPALLDVDDAFDVEPTPHDDEELPRDEERVTSIGQQPRRAAARYDWPTEPMPAVAWVGPRECLAQAQQSIMPAAAAAGRMWRNGRTAAAGLAKRVTAARTVLAEWWENQRACRRVPWQPGELLGDIREGAHHRRPGGLSVEQVLGYQPRPSAGGRHHRSREAVAA